MWALVLMLMAGHAGANLESPGLGKCLEIGYKLENGKTQAVMLACDSKPRQRVAMNNGQIWVYPGDYFACLTADQAKANSVVRGIGCEKDSPRQQWVLTENGNIQLKDSDLCLDVRAEKKLDGTYEDWKEIQQRDIVALQLYTCHEKCTKRVNQLFTWSQTAGRVTTNEEILHAYGGHFVSPGLQKCMEVGEAKSANDVVGVDMVECGVEPKQRIELRDGMIMHDEMCLSAEGSEANADVHFKQCGGPMQKWTLLEHGAIELQGTELCLDIRAELKADGSYEDWQEIKAHTVNDLHLYTCHDVSDQRVNQRWEWSPVGEEEMMTIQQGTRPDCPELASSVNIHHSYGGGLPTRHFEGGFPGDHPNHHHLHHVHGSMPNDAEEADELEMDKLLTQYAISPPPSTQFLSTPALVGVAAAAVLLAGVYKLQVFGRPAEPFEAQSLEMSE